MYYSLISSMSKFNYIVIDTDAQAFITAASITNNTQKSAIDNLVISLKSYGIWSKMKALYPMVGGTASSHKFNLKDPRDLNAAFRLTFSGGWTHSNNGALPNGTNAYSDSYLSASNLVKPFIGYYSKINTNTSTDQIDIGSSNGSSYLWLSAWYNGSGFSNILARNSSGSVLLNGGITNDSRGWYWTNKVNTVAKIGKNSIILNSATDLINPPNINIYVGAYNFNNGATLYSNRECAFASIGDGLTDVEASNFYTAVQAYQTSLSRQV